MESWTDLFLDYLTAERNDSPHTVVGYGRDIREFQAFLESLYSSADWTRVRAEDVREWIIYLLDERNISPASVNVKLSALRSFYRYLRLTGYVSINPMEKIASLKTSRPLPYFVRESEMDRLLELTLEDRSLGGIRDRLVIMMLYETGIRRSELLGLKDSDVDTVAMQVKVTGKRNKQRIIPFGNELKEEIQAYLCSRESELGLKEAAAFFVTDKGMPLTDSLLSSIVKDNLSKVTTIKKKSPHVLRHSFATAMLNNKADLTSIQKLLGHESVATTEIYTHVSFEELKNEYKNAHPRK